MEKKLDIQAEKTLDSTKKAWPDQKGDPVNVLVFISAVGLILLMPLAGILFTGGALSPYLDFPPRPVITSHPPFSVPVFLVFIVFILIFIRAGVLPFLRKGPAFQSRVAFPKHRSLPWWGFAAFLGLAGFWVLAWTRWDWFFFFQPHTFFPLWLCWIFCVNALIFRASGRCPMLESPFRFAALFFISSGFWWIFEYLNRFVGNWYYSGSQYGAGTYFVLATLSFSTVLPAVESMKNYLLTFPRFSDGFRQMPSLPALEYPWIGACLVFVSCILLFLTSVFPNQLFFLIWICPFLIFLGILIFSKKPHAFAGVKNGDYTLVVAYAVASLVCGFFWEMFNFYSLARWRYAIPYVQVLHLFEMPVLGYAGYLPFGLECGLIIGLVLNTRQNRP